MKISLPCFHWQQQILQSAGISFKNENMYLTENINFLLSTTWWRTLVKYGLKVQNTNIVFMIDSNHKYTTLPQTIGDFWLEPYISNQVSMFYTRPKPWRSNTEYLENRQNSDDQP